MSFPVWTETYELTDFFIEEESIAIRTQFFFYLRDKVKEAKYPNFNEKIWIYKGLTLDDDDVFFTIVIPPFCEGEAKLGVFLKDFSTLLDEMLVKWDRETVERLFTEAMQKIFPEYAANYELGFYERYGFLYCTVQRKGSSLAQEMSYSFMPPTRLMFQDSDPAWQEVEKQIRAHAARRIRHPRRASKLRDYLEEIDAEKTEEKEQK